MMETLAGVLLLVSFAAQLGEDAVARAKAAEARAFEAIDEERWCEAMHHFLEANSAAPSVDLIYNAAQAADLAVDRKRALQLYAELVGAYPGSERQAEVHARVRELTDIVAAEGEGTACQALPEETSEPAPALEPAPSPPAPADEAPALDAVLPWAVVGGGALIMAAGATLTAVGSLPYFSFLEAREQILAAEAAGTDAAALQQQQMDARASWQSWGELTLWSGAIAVVTGALVATGGLVWALTSAPDEEGPAAAEPEPSEDAPPTVSSALDEEPGDAALGEG